MGVPEVVAVVAEEQWVEVMEKQSSTLQLATAGIPAQRPDRAAGGGGSPSVTPSAFAPLAALAIGAWLGWTFVAALGATGGW